MRAARTFFYVAAGILALAGAFALGAQTAQGQGGSPVAVYVPSLQSPENIYRPGVILENGDVWYWPGGAVSLINPAIFGGSIYSGAPVQATETSWGRVKADRR